MVANLPIIAAGYRLICERLRAEVPDVDEETLADTVEGLTDLHEVLAAIVRAILEDEALAAGLRQRIEVLEGRFERLQGRASKRREIVRDAMIESSVRKVTAPDFTISLRPGSPALVIVDEAVIPQAFWEPRDPRLDRRSLIDELKHGRVVPGAELSKPQPILQVRTK
jgi:hypothetical protein